MLLYPLNRLATAKLRRFVKQSRLEHPDLFEMIDRVLDSFHDSGGLQWQGQDFKLFHLWQICVKQRPKTIVEFGSGSSTALLCAYSRQHDCSIVTVDESDEWLQNTKNLCRDHDPSKIEFVHAKRIEDISSAPPTCWYDWESDELFQLALVDGPSLNADPAIRRKQVCTDALRVNLPKVNATIAIDGRHSTFNFLSSNLDDTWRPQPTTHRHFAKTLLRSSYRSYSILSR